MRREFVCGNCAFILVAMAAASVTVFFVVAGVPGRALAQEDAALPAKVVGAGTTGDFSKFRKILASPTVNTPDPFKGFGGWCGWPDVCRLANGDLFVTYCAGYWHGSWPTPLDMPPEEEARWKKTPHAWIFDWDCPTGGKMMWIRSRDGGKTWTRPKAFPVVRGAYNVSELVQLRDGTMLAAAYIQESFGYWDRMPTTPLEYTKIAANRLPEQNVIFRSEDNGETWHEISRITGVGGRVDGVYSMFQSPDGSVLAIYNVGPIPGGKGWPTHGQVYEIQPYRWLTIVARSQDQGQTWTTIAVVGSNEFDTTEATGGYLPDGSIGFYYPAGLDLVSVVRPRPHVVVPAADSSWRGSGGGTQVVATRLAPGVA